MDTLHLNPRLRIKMPEALRWAVVGLSFLIVAVAWWVSDLWRLATWSKHQIEMDGALPRHKLAELSLFAIFITAGFAAITVLAVSNSWHFAEWVMLAFVYCYLYGVATYIRIAH